MLISSKDKRRCCGQGSVMGGYQENTVNKDNVVMQIYILAFPMIRVSRQPTSSSSYSEQDTRINIFLINVNFSYKRVTSKKRTFIRLSELHQCLVFLKNNQFRINNMPKRHILKWQNLLSFTFQETNKMLFVKTC